MTDRRLLLPVQKMLLDAADYIEKNGLVKGRYLGRPRKNGKYPACMVGAMIAVTDDYDERKFLEQVERGATYMSDRLGDYCIRWSDAKKRTAVEVVTALRDAAADYVETRLT